MAIAHMLVHCPSRKAAYMPPHYNNKHIQPTSQGAFVLVALFVLFKRTCVWLSIQGKACEKMIRRKPPGRQTDPFSLTTPWFQFARAPIKSSLRRFTAVQTTSAMRSSAWFLLQPLGGTNLYLLVNVYASNMHRLFAISFLDINSISWFSIKGCSTQRAYSRSNGRKADTFETCKLSLSTCIPVLSLRDSHVKEDLMWQVQAQTNIECKFGNDNPWSSDTRLCVVLVQHA